MIHSSQPFQVCNGACVLRLILQDKAALLANMQPEAVARLLGLMDPNEAVLLLSALGDGNSRLVSQALSSEERDRMVEVGGAATSAVQCAHLCLHATALNHAYSKGGVVLGKHIEATTL